VGVERAAVERRDEAARFGHDERSGRRVPRSQVLVPEAIHPPASDVTEIERGGPEPPESLRAERDLPESALHDRVAYRGAVWKALLNHRAKHGFGLDVDVRHDVGLRLPGHAETGLEMAEVDRTGPAHHLDGGGEELIAAMQHRRGSCRGCARATR